MNIMIGHPVYCLRYLYFFFLFPSSLPSFWACARYFKLFGNVFEYSPRCYRATTVEQQFSIRISILLVHTYAHIHCRLFIFGFGISTLCVRQTRMNSGSSSGSSSNSCRSNNNINNKTNYCPLHLTLDNRQSAL